MLKAKIEICDANIVDSEKVNRVKLRLQERQNLQELSQTFKALSDPTRLKIVLALAQEELCVCDLAALADVSISAISHQLRLLRNMRLVSYRKEGKMVYYRLDDEHVENLIHEASRHVEERGLGEAYSWILTQKQMKFMGSQNRQWALRFLAE